MERAIKAEEKAVVPVGSPITLGQQPKSSSPKGGLVVKIRLETTLDCGFICN